MPPVRLKQNGWHQLPDKPELSSIIPPSVPGVACQASVLLCALIVPVKSALPVALRPVVSTAAVTQLYAQAFNTILAPVDLARGRAGACSHSGIPECTCGRHRDRRSPTASAAQQTAYRHKNHQPAIMEVSRKPRLTGSESDTDICSTPKPTSVLLSRSATTVTISALNWPGEQPGMPTLTTSSAQMVVAARQRIEEIETPDLISRLNDPDIVIVDIRDVRERQRSGFIPGSFHAPRGMIEFWVDPESPYFKDIFGQDKTFIFHCASGWRSALTVATLQDMGFEAAHLKEGFSTWEKHHGPVEHS